MLQSNHSCFLISISAPKFKIMYVKLAVSSLILLSLVITDTKFFYNSIKDQLNSGSRKCTAEEHRRPLRVFMYDLPWKFHVGLFGRQRLEPWDDHHDQYGSGGVITARDLPPWPKRHYDTRSQHSIEYWLMASLLYDEDEDGEMEAVRVSDPETADVFFVPFFSSLSSHTPRVPAKWGLNISTDREMQAEIIEFLHSSKYWQRSGGRDHIIPMTHPRSWMGDQRLLLNASILILVDFSGQPKGLSSPRKDVVAPYAHLVDSFPDDDKDPNPFESRTTLLFFKGYTYRNLGPEGMVRLQLAKVLSGLEDVFFEHGIAIKGNVEVSTHKMRLSKFCLVPLGDTPTSCRLFDAIISHCVPVIVSDRIELPFEDELDYTEFSIFVSLQDALRGGNYLVNQLRQFPKDRWLQMWRRLKQVSHHFEFQYPPKKDDAVNMLWRQVKRKLSGIKFAVHRSRRLII